MINLGERIIKLRKEKGLRQSELSRSLKIPQATLSQYEQGKREISAEWLLKMAIFFDVSVEYLIGVTEFRKGTRFLNDVFFEVGEKRVKSVELYGKLDKLAPECKGVINNMVDIMLTK